MPLGTMLRRTAPAGALAMSAIVLSANGARAQEPPAPLPSQVVSVPPMLPLPPATKLEAFQPAVGSVLTVAFDELGRVEGIAVDVREMRDSHGTRARGVVVRVADSDRHQEMSFIDEDELPDLLKGIDALLDVRGNPTTFKNFEVQYATRGELVLTVFNTPNGSILFAVQAGRPVTARRAGLSTAEMLKLRGMFESGNQKLIAAR
jgi:hypothetical protein